jgi:hypothetical protein
MADDLDPPGERPCRFCGALPPDPRFVQFMFSLLAQVKELEAECASLRERVQELERPDCG